MIGKTISRYKIIEKLGEGGMGEDCKTDNSKLERTVILRFLPATLICTLITKAIFIRDSQEEYDLVNSQI